MQETINFLVNSVNDLGYIGIFLLMFLESSFFPFPSEIVMVPAGYLASKGEINLFLSIFFAVIGSISGAWFNYLLAHKFGRNFISKFISQEKLSKLDNFFEKHGHISTFTGRLLPGIRQYISFPAGLANMNKLQFTLYTGLGSFIWVTILTLLGYFIGRNEDLIHYYLKEITLGLVFLIVIILFFYFKAQK